jgi:hypothetical protein
MAGLSPSDFLIGWLFCFIWIGLVFCGHLGYNSDEMNVHNLANTAVGESSRGEEFEGYPALCVTAPTTYCCWVYRFHQRWITLLIREEAERE